MPTSRTTATALNSYAYGQWYAGKGDGIILQDASTGQAVATIDATGLDYQAMLGYARDKGGPALRAMTFHQRALLLKSLGLHLMANKEAFYALSTATGATRTDSWIDIEGGISTLLSYGSKGRRELPNTQLLMDGDVEPLSKDNSFAALHLLSPMEGVAVHINAYNFPCWGMLEKLAPTLLAGLPAIIKPASQTAYLTELMVRHIIESGILPEGSLQLICGSTGDLLDHVGPQDTVTFTGSAATGHHLKSNRNIIANATRFTMEADSLNATILGTDVNAGSEEFELCVREIVREMTSKTGQKCTAIRRVLAPADRVEELMQAVVQKLEAVPIGLPNDENVKMGPVASLAQRQEVLENIEALKTEARVVTANPEAVPLVSGNAADGAFLKPVLLHCEKPQEATKVHAVEAFGPVCTVMPYEHLDDAASLVRRGEGSLVASVFTNDTEVARELVTRLAPWHGRVLIGNRRSAKTSTGHGSPLPMLTHGGPGRAGGGEELGGIRAVKHYLQRTAIQGTPDMLSAVAGRWISGASTKTDAKRHPFRKSLAELEIGDAVLTERRTVTLDDIEHFAHFTGDTFYAHMDEAAAKANPFFEGRVAHGYLIVSFAAGLFVDPDVGPVLANYGVDNLRFMAPVNPDDSLQVMLVCKEINPRENEDYGEVRWDCTVRNQDEQIVAHYDVLTLVAKTLH